MVAQAHHATWVDPSTSTQSTADVHGRRALRPAGTSGAVCPPSVAELFRLPTLKSGTLYRNTSSQFPRSSPSDVS